MRCDVIRCVRSCAFGSGAESLRCPLSMSMGGAGGRERRGHSVQTQQRDSAALLRLALSSDELSRAEQLSAICFGVSYRISSPIVSYRFVSVSKVLQSEVDAMMRCERRGEETRRGAAHSSAPVARRTSGRRRARGRHALPLAPLIPRRLTASIRSQIPLVSFPFVPSIPFDSERLFDGCESRSGFGRTMRPNRTETIRVFVFITGMYSVRIRIHHSYCAVRKALVRKQLEASCAAQHCRSRRVRCPPRHQSSAVQCSASTRSAPGGRAGGRMGCQRSGVERRGENGRRRETSRADAKCSLAAANRMCGVESSGPLPVSERNRGAVGLRATPRHATSE